mgnify:CR=1 FL=1
MPCMFMQPPARGKLPVGSTVRYRTLTRVVPDPNDQTFDHQTPDHQTFDDPTPHGGGPGSSARVCIDIKGRCVISVRLALTICLCLCLVYVLLTTLGSSSEPYHIHMV